jgi:hypothetical protein
VFQFYIKRYGTWGDNADLTSAYPPTSFQLTLRVVGVSEASPKNVWLKDYTSLALAKNGAAALFASGTVTPWVDNANSYESLSAVFTPTF